MQIALRKRETHQDILCKMIYPITISTINVLHQQGMTLNIEQFKEVIASLLIELCQNTGVEQEQIDFMVFCAKKTEIIQYIISNNTCPDLGAFINNTAILSVNNYGINYFHKNYDAFFSMFIPQEIANGYPSNETFAWANEEQMHFIVMNLIPCYGQRIVLFNEKLQYLDDYQVIMLTPQQTKAIKNANIQFPKNSAIYQKIYGNEKEVSSNGQSECCLLI